ncbi:MAG TPA: HAD-IC family P-type ATPase, partial [Ramlibacter sp.]|nr:HAD-IC family P-type ATPase [Ramlibacter sp.]
RMAVVATRLRPGVDGGWALSLAAALARQSLHPAAQAIAAAAPGEGPEVSEIVEVAGRGMRGRVDAVAGQPARELRLGSASFCDAPVQSGESVGPQVHLADQQGWLASFDLDEAIRQDAAAAMAALHSFGLRLQLLSGDRGRGVKRLARRAGIEVSRGDCSPEDKLQHVREAQQQGHRVAMVGDGMNDGPVLARADVSIAMGEAVPLAQARSDFVVLGGQLQAVASLWTQARRTRDVVRQNLAWAAVYNAVCVPLAVVGAMPPWLAGLGMAASSLLVVANSARLARIPVPSPVPSSAMVPPPPAVVSAA